MKSFEKVHRLPKNTDLSPFFNTLVVDEEGTLAVYHTIIAPKTIPKGAKMELVFRVIEPEELEWII